MSSGSARKCCLNFYQWAGLLQKKHALQILITRGFRSAVSTSSQFKHSHKERTFLMVKPCGVQRGLVGEIIRRFEHRGFQLVGMKFTKASDGIVHQHYEEHRDKPFFPILLQYLTSGPVVPMVWEGEGVVQMARSMIGATDGSKAAVGTIRGDYGMDRLKNIIHGSDSVESADREISIWFDEQEIINWHPALSSWVHETSS